MIRKSSATNRLFAEIKMTDHIEIRDAIINAAVTLAAQKSWEAVRLYDVARDLNLTLDQIHRYFREKEDVA
jgi:AcrR family transcriptional regulator